jgi:hypothetical protein
MVAGAIIGSLPYTAYNLITPGSVPWFYDGPLSGVGAPGYYRSYLQSFALPVSMLWPAASLVTSSGARLLMASVGAGVSIWWGRRLMRLPDSAVEIAVLGIIAIFWTLNIVSGSVVEYYTFALAPLIALVAGGVMAAVVGRLNSARAWQVAHAIVIGSGSILLVTSLVGTERGAADEEWPDARIARGYAFYWPEPYEVFSGYKTELGLTVERVASATQFIEPPDPAPPEKTIFISRGQHVRYPLRTRNDYYVYGADVTFLGVTRLTAQAVREIEPRFWPETFGSIAVFAANDFLIDELIAMFANGSIDRSVPECCVKMFYSELGRKIRDQSAQQRQEVRSLLDTLPPAKRAWVNSGLSESCYVDYHVPVWRRPKGYAPIGQCSALTLAAPHLN